MRATIFNICAILSLFSVAIHAAPEVSARFAPFAPPCELEGSVCTGNRRNVDNAGVQLGNNFGK